MYKCLCTLFWLWKLLDIHVYCDNLFKWVLIAFIVYLTMRGTCAFWYIHICNDVFNNISCFPYHHIPVSLLLTRMILFPWKDTTASYSHILPYMAWLWIYTMLKKIPNETLYMYNTCTCIWIDYNELARTFINYFPRPHKKRGDRMCVWNSILKYN